MRSMGRGTSRRLVEGKCATVEYMPDNRVQVSQHIGSPDPNDPYALRRNPCIALHIMRHLAGVVMHSAVHLDRDPRGGIIEIQHIKA
jgi:hypothetical protein